MLRNRMSSLVVAVVLAALVQSVALAEGERGKGPGNEFSAPRADRLYFVKYDEVQCFVPPCANWKAVAENGATTYFTRLDLSPLGADAAHEAQILAEIAAGLWVVRATVGSPLGTGPDLSVLELVEPVNHYHVHFDDDVHCLTEPCANWTAMDSNGNTEQFTDIDLTALRLDEEVESQLRAELAAGLWSVRASRRDPIGPRLTLVVFELLHRPMTNPK